MKRTALTRGKLAVLLGLLTIGPLLACVHHHPPRHHRRAKVVVVPRGHVHSARCGHYRYRGRWYYLHSHVHKAGCGHALVQGVWVLKD